jgi:hypothetical protein
MMAINPSVQSQVIAAAVAALNAAAVGYTAYRCRMAAFLPEQLPAWNVIPEDDDPDYNTDAYSGTVAWKFRFRVRCMVASVGEVDAAADPLFVAACQAILADPTLGGLAVVTRIAGVKWEREAKGEYDQCAEVIVFESEFGTSRSDPSVRVP